MIHPTCLHPNHHSNLERWVLFPPFIKEEILTPCKWWHLDLKPCLYVSLFSLSWQDTSRIYIQNKNKQNYWISNCVWAWSLASFLSLKAILFIESSIRASYYFLAPNSASSGFPIIVNTKTTHSLFSLVFFSFQSPHNCSATSA